MRHARALLPAAALAVLLPAAWLGLPGCGRKPATQAAHAPVPDLRQELALEQEQRGQAERLLEEAEARLQAAEARLKTAELDSRRWQVRALWLGGAAVLALVAGTALGSGARRAARRERDR